MQITRGPLISPQATAAEMTRLVKAYAGDLGEKAAWPLSKFFNYVKNLPYRRDPQRVESIARPALAMNPKIPWRDCDDKSILLAAWCESNFYPWRFVASSKRPDKTLHHVFVEAQGPNKPIYLDATYHFHKLGSLAANYTSLEPLTGWNMPQIQILEGDELGFLPKGVKRIGRKAVNVVTTPARVIARPVVKGAKIASRVVGRAMPDIIKRNVEKAVRGVVGNRAVTPAIKAAVIGPATAAALAVPGVQPYAVAVPIVLNEILNKMIDEAKKKIGVSTQPAAAPAPAKSSQGFKNLRAKIADAKTTIATAKEPAAPKLDPKILAIGAAGLLGAFLLMGKKR